MDIPTPSPKIAVIIATCNRPQMLAERSIPSVISQTQCPDLLIIVDDSNAAERVANRERVTSLTVAGCEVVYAENNRTRGASGTWNTAIDILVDRLIDLSNVFVAILDDDDCWSADYLERCSTLARVEQLDMVAADLRRFEAINEPPILNKGPEQLRADDFLTGNPGIQGSNLFLRLSVLLAAGGFDEALPSTTDRDLCIRLADLGYVRFGRLPFALVDHYADPDRMRLSTKGSAAKTKGLGVFWQKYGGRMTDEQRTSFLDRAKALFGWQPPHDMKDAFGHVKSPMRAIVLGVIVDNSRVNEAMHFTRDLVARIDETLAGLDILLFEKGPRNASTTPIDVLSEMLRNTGVGCFTISLERQQKDLEQGVFLPHPDSATNVEVDSEKSMLAYYCSRVAAARVGTEIWILEEPVQPTSVPQDKPPPLFLKGFGAKALSPDHPRHSKTTTEIEQWLHTERVATARCRVLRTFSLEKLQLLGAGSEAVVFTDGGTVYKCIDYWKTRMPRTQLEFLRKHIGQWDNLPGLYSLKAVLVDGCWAVITYDYEESTPYSGGHEADLIRLLKSCSEVGIVCNNIHPKNLIVTHTEVKLIDYGSDVRPWTPLGFEHMVRRAFLAFKQASNPNLQELMRSALRDERLLELEGYERFREKVNKPITMVPKRSWNIDKAHATKANLYVGVISSEPKTLEPLLNSLVPLRFTEAIEKLTVIVLDNGCPKFELDAVIQGARNAALSIAVVEFAQQEQDAASGSFGATFQQRPLGQVGIAQARTMLQKYLGELLAADAGAFGWLLDDDMRVDARALDYLPWLQPFRERGTDVLIGAYEISSPNPPLNGLRVQLVDLLHNLHWLRRMPAHDPLPDRTAENAVLRARYPDYYYDLSRKHSAHVELPHWLEPAVEGETVGEAYRRLIQGAVGLLNGIPLTRPLVATSPCNPLSSSKESVNRGGCTFVLNHDALRKTPNSIVNIQGREARRSDMVWAIVNRYYRRMTLKAVGFPIQHIGRIHALPNLNIEKVQSEIVGSTLYAGLTDFLRRQPHHTLAFSPADVIEISRMANCHLERRWRLLRQSFYRIAGLSEALRRAARPGELQELIRYLDEWFTPKQFQNLRAGVSLHDSEQLVDFLTSLRHVADDYAAASVDIGFIEEQLDL